MEDRLKSITINASNAFGIGQLDCSFSLNKNRCIAIYAPNGTCKTSLRKALEAWSKNEPIKDNFFPERDSSFEIAANPPEELGRANVFCFRSMGDLASARFFDDRLLASPGLKEQYIQDKESHDAELRLLLATLRKELASGASFPKDAEMAPFIAELTGFDDIGRALTALVDRADSMDEPLFVTKYKLGDVISKSVEKALSKPGVKETLADYARVRGEVLEKSVYFGDGFDYLAASSLADELGKSGFFNARHALLLHSRDDAGTKAITSLEEYREVIDAEVERANSAPVVIEHFKIADEKLGKAQTIKRFKEIISSDQEVASAVGDPQAMKLSFLVHAVQLHREEVTQYLGARESYFERMGAFQKKLAEEQSGWDFAVQLFRSRFRLPITPYVKNRASVVLGDSEPIIAFKYQNRDVNNDLLIENLSEGEKKALYMLSVIFEIERSKRLPGAKLFVFDDVVDSFDYINKYAFIEYLRDFVSGTDAYAVLLTHNFDFFRTVTSRLGADFSRDNCLLAEKDGQGVVSLKKVDFIKQNPLRRWKAALCDDLPKGDVKKIASIAMVRELVEMREGDKSERYGKLSSVLHGRDDAGTVTFDDLDDCFEEYLGVGSFAGDFRNIQKVLMEECGKIVNRGGRLELEEKIVLAIGIRVIVEHCLLSCYDRNNIERPSVNTLGRLISSFKKDCPVDYSRYAECVEQAALIVPENIHANAFMYEPLIDIGSHRFIGLYKDCLNL